MLVEFIVLVDHHLPEPLALPKTLQHKRQKLVLHQFIACMQYQFLDAQAAISAIPTYLDPISFLIITHDVGVVDKNPLAT